jgi:hypothetical protein
MFFGKRKKVQNSLAIPVNSVTVTSMKIQAQPQQREIKLFPSNPVHLASNLTGKTVRYENFHPKSNVADYKKRTFKIKSIEDVSVSQATGSRYVTAKVQDVDDGGAEKYRNLILDGIEVIV